MSMSFKTKRPQKQLSFKSECLLVREVYQNHLSKKVVLVSKSLMGENGLTGELTGDLTGRKIILK